MSKMSLRYKQILGQIKEIDSTKREFEFVASRQEVDGDKEVVVTRGIDIETRYAQNRTMFLDHDRSRRYARVDALWLGSVRGADALLGRATVLPPGVSAEADQAYAEMVHGALNAISIGFIPKEIDPAPILPGQRGVTYKAVELMEISLVPLGSCPSAVVTAKSLEGTDVRTDSGSSAERDFFAALGLRQLLIQRAQNWPSHASPMVMPQAAPPISDVIPPECRSYQPTGPIRAHRGNLTLEISDWPGRSSRRGLPSKPAEATFEVEPADVTEAIRCSVREFVQDLRGEIDRQVLKAVNRLRGRVD